MKGINGIVAALVAAGTLGLAGCGEDGPATSTPTQTVEWFQAHETEREAVLADCANNPGEMRDVPNCVNAQKAERIESSGSAESMQEMFGIEDKKD
ncbi:EexN family lipoprotein [Guyparkeria sp.]|uniref:EexN family lipoprotein n=1 Tax=Guyparkeria sp. TaxID=2035736 RepID=UPI0039709FBE